MDRIINKFFILGCDGVLLMSAKKSRIEPRTLIYILIVVIIIAGIAYFVLSYEPSETLTVSQVNAKSGKLIGDTIDVEGVYYKEGAGGDYLIPTYTSVANQNPTERLSLNLSNIGNDTNLVEDQQYHVKGVLTENQFGFIELKVEEIKEK